MSGRLDRQAPQVPAAIRDKLLDYKGKTVTFLNNLTTDIVLPDGTVRKAAMPVSAFVNVKALAICLRREWGVLGSYTDEVAFISRKIITPDGDIKWSAPFFMRGQLIGVGATLGTLRSGNCYALMNEEAVQSFCRPRISVGCNAHFLVDMNGSRLRPATLDSTCVDDVVVTDAHGGMMAKYFRLNAMMVAFEVRGGKFRPYQKINRALYGDSAMDEVLAGRLPCPAEFRSVLEELNKLTSAAAAANRKLHPSRSRAGSAGGSLHGSSRHPAIPAPSPSRGSSTSDLRGFPP